MALTPEQIALMDAYNIAKVAKQAGPSLADVKTASDLVGTRNTALKTKLNTVGGSGAQTEWDALVAAQTDYRTKSAAFATNDAAVKSAWQAVLDGAQAAAGG